MTRASISLTLAGLCLALSLPATAGESETHTAVTELQWGPTPFGPEASVVSGDFTKGNHITYIKFEAGTKTPLHTHTSDYVGIVISGTTKHWLPGKPETEKPLSAGSHWFIPGGTKHVSECLPGKDCVMAIYQKKSMDFLPVED